MRFLKRALRKLLQRQGFVLFNANRPEVYAEDGLATHHNHSFLSEDGFLAAYRRGIAANDGVDHKMRWRAHVAYWAAGEALKLPGAVVECGVSTGFLMSGIMLRNDWNALGKDCYLFDTFAGLDERFVSAEEQADGRLDYYETLSEARTRKNFEKFQRIHFVVGAVPETLGQADIDAICYLSLDMNAAEPEIAAFRHFWPKMTPGGWVVLDDYTYSGYDAQHHAFNDLAAELGFSILGLPTGQGLIQKPLTAPSHPPQSVTEPL